MDQEVQGSKGGHEAMIDRVKATSRILRRQRLKESSMIDYKMKI